jgi:hypothetical protein
MQGPGGYSGQRKKSIFEKVLDENASDDLEDDGDGFVVSGDVVDDANQADDSRQSTTPHFILCSLKLSPC